MKEVVVISPHQWEIRDVPIPVITDDHDVLIQMKAAGVCGSDHHIFHGSNPCSTYPRIPGHENVGVVAAVGPKVSRVAVGDHVAVDLIITCGECWQCKTGRKNVCENVLVRGSGTDGGWREYFTVPETDVYCIPKEIPWKDAALIEPFAIGGHCTRRGRLAGDDMVFILGSGTIGSIILQVCKAAGATVICADINDESLARAKGYGADLTVNTQKEGLIPKVEAFTDGKGVSLAFDAACYKGSLTSLFQPGLMRNAGRIVSLGFCTEPEAISQAMLDQRELDLIGSRMSCHQFEPTIATMAAGAFQLDGVATTFIQFSNISRVFDYMKHPEPTVKKMVILFD